MLNLPNEFTAKYRKLLGSKADRLFAAMSDEMPKKAFRINSLKEKQDIGYALTKPVPGINNAYYGQVNGSDPEWVSGLVYSQEPAAMFPAQIAMVKPGDKVLDLCAAPGGKSTALAEQLKGNGLLVANDISYSRAKILRENLERWGATNALITNEGPAKLAQCFNNFFDKVVVDAPCSGEGMFRKNPDAVSYWSQDYVLTCQSRQKEILASATEMLRPGGELIYSTCTFAPEEDEQIVSWLAQTYGYEILPINLANVNLASGNPDWADQNPALANTLRFWPYEELGEGQFVAKLQKPASSVITKAQPQYQKRKREKTSYEPLTKKEVEFITSVLKPFNLPPALSEWPKHCLVSHNHVFLPALTKNTSHLKILNNGFELGLLKKNRFEPSHQLAMILSQVEQKHVLELSKLDFAAFLHGETLRGQDKKMQGFVLLSHQHLIFSFGKNTKDGVLKNFYPKGLRILKKD